MRVCHYRRPFQRFEGTTSLVFAKRAREWWRESPGPVGQERGSPTRTDLRNLAEQDRLMISIPSITDLFHTIVSDKVRQDKIRCSNSNLRFKRTIHATQCGCWPLSCCKGHSLPALAHVLSTSPPSSDPPGVSLSLYSLIGFSERRGTMVQPITITADEVNCLIYAYFEDSGKTSPSPRSTPTRRASFQGFNIVRLSFVLKED